MEPGKPVAAWRVEIRGHIAELVDHRHVDAAVVGGQEKGVRVGQRAPPVRPSLPRRWTPPIPVLVAAQGFSRGHRFVLGLPGHRQAAPDRASRGWATGVDAMLAAAGLAGNEKYHQHIILSGIWL